MCALQVVDRETFENVRFSQAAFKRGAKTLDEMHAEVYDVLHKAPAFSLIGSLHSMTNFLDVGSNEATDFMLADAFKKVQQTAQTEAAKLIHGGDIHL